MSNRSALLKKCIKLLFNNYEICIKYNMLKMIVNIFFKSMYVLIQNICKLKSCWDYRSFYNIFD